MRFRSEKQKRALAQRVLDVMRATGGKGTPPSKPRKNRVRCAIDVPGVEAKRDWRKTPTANLKNAMQSGEFDLR